MKNALFAALVFSGCALSGSKAMHINVQCGNTPTLNEEIKLGAREVEIDLTQVNVVDNKLRCYVEVYEAK